MRARPRRRPISSTWWDSPVGVLVFGAVAVAVVLFALTSTSTTFARNLPLAGVTQDIELHLSQSHLWLEERLSGDTTIDVDEQIHGSLGDARELCAALVEGGRGHFGAISAVSGTDNRARLQHLCGEIDHLRRLTDARLANADTSAAGSDADQAYDETFGHLMSDIDSETAWLESSIRDDQDRLRQFNTGVAVLLGLLFLVMAGLVKHNRRTTEARNAESAELAAIVESSDEAIVGTDAEAMVTSWNPAAERLYGYRADEIVGRPAAVLVPATLKEDGLLIERARRGERVNNVETQRMRKDGSVFDVSLTVSRIFHGRELSGFSVIARDVSERKLMEAALTEARDQALEASRLKSEFLANMSHEIRTPMNGVIGLTGLLLGTDLDDRQRQYAEGVQGAADALLDVINDILDFSKIEAGKLEVEVVDFDLRQVVEESADLLAGPAQRKGLELVAYCDPRLPMALRGDPGRLRQVLLNLVSNAVKFTEQGEVVVRARPAETSAAADNTVAVHFEVTDTGIGLDSEHAQRLFEPFTQADASTTRRYGGTGLGLAISAELVSAMGGQLRVDTRPGQGSRFWFTLPLERQPDGAATQPARPHRLEGLRVLVVDDNETNRLILCEQLTAWQLRPDAVADGPSALELLREAAEQNSTYELALLDLCMEPMDGLELAQRVSADPQLADTRLILLSSASDVDTARAADARLAARLTKPVRQSQLYDTLMRVTAPDPEVVPTSAERASAPRTVPSRGHLLVVEDNATNQMVAVGILEELHYSADVAANGLEALEALHAGDYAAVLMDCQMPEMDGYQATAEFRRREGEGRHLPVIAMTAGAMEGDRERCLAAGMDDYVSKPVDPEELEAALQRWVPEADGAAPAPPPLDPARTAMLQHMGRGDGDMLRRIGEAFAAQTPADLAALDDAIAEGDSAAVAGVAHRLRGAAANLGATALASICAEIEDLVPAGELTTARDLLPALRAEFARVADALAVATARP